ncbi:hypothetical protein [Flavobacterium sp. '19STA2R22 D10 B1']|uniref:hypothetical protein n=1 Tax=Flavobacterium aerium TaxID=3037261 RepID=UPI00278C0C9A|nr:hypothetical protein [Flavobacterium sp. '19STA2R22 D10 B1']
MGKFHAILATWRLILIMGFAFSSISASNISKTVVNFYPTTNSEVLLKKEISAHTKSVGLYHFSKKVSTPDFVYFNHCRVKKQLAGSGLASHKCNTVEYLYSIKNDFTFSYKIKSAIKIYSFHKGRLLSAFYTFTSFW